MIKSAEHFLWALVAIIIIGSPLTYLIAFYPGQAFWDSVFSGLISTAAALIGGIPIALAIDRALKRKEMIRQDQEGYHSTARAYALVAAVGNMADPAVFTVTVNNLSTFQVRAALEELVTEKRGVF